MLFDDLYDLDYLDLNDLFLYIILFPDNFAGHMHDYSSRCIIHWLLRELLDAGYLLK